MPRRVSREAIRELYARGVPASAIAKALGISKSTVRRALREDPCGREVELLRQRIAQLEAQLQRCQARQEEAAPAPAPPSGAQPQPQIENEWIKLLRQRQFQK